MSYQKKETDFKQIVKANAKDKLIEAIDSINIGKIMLNIVDYSEGKGDKLKSASTYMDLKVAKVIAKAILAGNDSIKVPNPARDIEFYYLNQQKLKSFQEPDEEGKVDNEILQIIYNEKMKLNWQINIENGKAVPEMTSTGGYKAKSGSYKSLVSLKINLSKMDMLVFMNEILDRIQYREQINVIKHLEEENSKSA